MKFRMMSKEMLDSEIEQVLHMVFPFAQIKEIVRVTQTNYIHVSYFFSEESGDKYHQINFLPDDIYLIDDEDFLDEVLVEQTEVIYRYRQFMLAKGYSEMWLNNPFI